MRARVEALPAFAAIARSHDEPVLAGEIAVVIVNHLDCEHGLGSTDVDLAEMPPAVVGVKEFAAVADDKRAVRLHRPHIEEHVCERDRRIRQLWHRDLAMASAY